MEAGKRTLNFFRSPDAEGLEILTCTDVSYEFPPHFHDAYCIWLNVNGAEVYTHSGSTNILSPGDLGIIAPGEVHSNSTYNADSRGLVTFYLYDTCLRELAEDIQDSAKNSGFRTRYQKDLRAIALLLNLKKALFSGEPSLYKKERMLEAFAHLLVQYGEPDVSVPGNGYETGRVRKMIEIFYADLAEDIKLEQLAEELGCTQYYLIRLFKKHVGLSPHAYLIQLRLEKAKRLLMKGGSLSFIAAETGFADQSHLTRHFKSRFGIPPGRYMQELS